MCESEVAKSTQVKPKVIKPTTMIVHMDPYSMGNDFAEYEIKLQQFLL